MSILTRMTVVNIHNVTDPNVSLGNKRLLAAAINATATMIEDGAQPELAAIHAIEHLLHNFEDVLKHTGDPATTVSPEYEESVRESIKYFKRILEG